MKNYIYTLCFLLCAFPVLADSDRPDLDIETLQKPAVVKALYREAWMADNMPELASAAQLELMRANSPDLDADTHKIMDRGTKTLKNMQFGQAKQDLSAQAPTIQSNPSQAVSRLSTQIQAPESAVRAFEAADTIQASERLNAKVDKQNKIGRKTYNINVDLFK